MADAALEPRAVRDAVRAPKPPVLWAIAVAAVALSVAVTLTSDHVRDPGVQAALMNWITVTYVFAGLVAWGRRPESWTGPLMIAAGFSAFLSGLSSANTAALFTIGIAFDLVPAVLFLHVFLSFPSGRLEGPVERGLVAAGYVTAFGLQLVGLALGGFGPDNLLEVVAEPETAYTLLRVQLTVLAGISLAGIGVLAMRRRRAGRPAGRALALLVDSFAIALVMIAVLYLSAAFGLVNGELAFEWVRRVALFGIGLADRVEALGGRVQVWSPPAQGTRVRAEIPCG